MFRHPATELHFPETFSITANTIRSALQDGQAGFGHFVSDMQVLILGSSLAYEASWKDRPDRLSAIHYMQMELLKIVQNTREEYSSCESGGLHSVAIPSLAC